MSIRLAHLRSAMLAAVLGTLGITGLCAPAFATSPGDDALQRLVSIDMKGASAEDVSAQLSQLIGEPVNFVPTDPEFQVSMQVSRYPVGLFLRDLSKVGAVAIGGQPLAARPASSAQLPDLSQRVSLNAKGIDARTLSRILTGLVRDEVEFRPMGQSEATFRIDLDVKGVALGELLKRLEQLGTISASTLPQ